MQCLHVVKSVREKALSLSSFSQAPRGRPAPFILSCYNQGAVSDLGTYVLVRSQCILHKKVTARPYFSDAVGSTSTLQVC